MDSASPIFDIVEFVFGILIFFVSIVWLVFPFIVMNRMRIIREEIEKTSFSIHVLTQELAKGNRFLAKIAISTEPKAVPPQPRGETPKLTIAKGGEELGRMDIGSVKALVKRGELTLHDHYFDVESKEWMTLDSHPEFC